jgi:hypothetical protein
MPIQNKDDLKKHIQELLRLKNIEQEYKNKINELKGSSDNIESNIVAYMNDNDFLDKEIIFDKNKLKCSNLKTSENITKKLLFDRLNVFLRSEEKATNAVKFIYENRKVSNKLTLKISNMKE